MGWPTSFVFGCRGGPRHLPSFPCRRSSGLARQRWFALLRAFLWFSGLFSKHRTCMNVILEPLRRSLRYGRNGPCFVGFRGRLTLQTPRNVEERRRNERSEKHTAELQPQSNFAFRLLLSFNYGARPWPTRMAELPCWGARVSARFFF